MSRSGAYKLPWHAPAPRGGVKTQKTRMRTEIQHKKVKTPKKSTGRFLIRSPIKRPGEPYDCQNVCYGGVRLHHANSQFGGNIWDYTKAAQVLLCLPGHPHREQWDMVDVHTQCPIGISNHSATEYAFEYTNQTATPAGTIWRDELYLVVESYKIINISVDRRTRRVGVSSKLN